MGGLCNAYCEATDCYLEFDGDTGTNPDAGEQACTKLHDKFIQSAGDAGSSIPVGSLELCEEESGQECTSKDCMDEGY